jgi:hypothetical protein
MVPTFNQTLTKAHALPPPLKPRAQWMKDTPPFMSQAEADATFNAAMFGTSELEPLRTDPTSTETADLQAQIKVLEARVRQRAKEKLTGASRPPLVLGATSPL